MRCSTPRCCCGWRRPAARTALQDSNQKLLQAAHRRRGVPAHGGGGELSRGEGSYQGVDLLHDLNQGLFSELKQPEPVIDLYRRELQRRYVGLLVSSFSSSAGEFRVALRAGSVDLAGMLTAAGQKVRDPRDTRAPQRAAERYWR